MSISPTELGALANLRFIAANGGAHISGPHETPVGRGGYRVKGKIGAFETSVWGVDLEDAMAPGTSASIVLMPRGRGRRGSKNDEANGTVVAGRPMDCVEGQAARA